MTYSWILPIKNEAQSLKQLISEIDLAMKYKSYEIIAVNDASTDNTKNVLRLIKKANPHLKIITFRQAQGKWAALAKGFSRAKGTIVITIDADLQDNPLEVHKLLQQLKYGYYMVSGWRKVRFDPFYKVSISRLGNMLSTAITGETCKDMNASYKVYRKEVLSALPKQGSLFRFSLLFAKKMCYKTIEVPVKHRPRIYGKSKFGIVKYFRIIYDLILVTLLFSGSGSLKDIKNTTALKDRI